MSRRYQHLVRIALLLLFAVTQASAAGRVDWRSDGYQIALWKLYHGFQPLMGKTWEQAKEMQESAGLVEDDGYPVDPLETRVYNMQGKALRAVRCSHTVEVRFSIDRRTGLLIVAEPSIRFDFARAMSLPAAKKIFDDNSVVARVLRLRSVETAILSGRDIESIIVDFGEVRNRWLEYGCNGFTVAIYLSSQAGTGGTLMYWAGSGLDPFVDRKGRTREGSPKSRNILIDPEYGIPCEAERSGARVIVKNW